MGRDTGARQYRERIPSLGAEHRSPRLQKSQTRLVAETDTGPGRASSAPREVLFGLRVEPEPAESGADKHPTIGKKNGL